MKEVRVLGCDQHTNCIYRFEVSVHDFMCMKVQKTQRDVMKLYLLIRHES
jgi:hypothetical protein